MVMQVGPIPSKELKEMIAQTGICEDCKGPVKMMRDKMSGDLLFHSCCCLQCGQIYHMNIADKDKEAWEMEQWRQKAVRILDLND